MTQVKRKQPLDEHFQMTESANFYSIYCEQRICYNNMNVFVHIISKVFPVSIPLENHVVH